MMGHMISTRTARRIRTGINVGRNLAANPDLVPMYMLTLFATFSRIEVRATARAGGDRLGVVPREVVIG